MKKKEDEGPPGPEGANGPVSGRDLAAFFAENQTMVAGVIMTVAGAITHSDGLVQAGVVITLACSWINDARRKHGV